MAAGAYNIGWGLFTMACPQWPFDLAGMQPANHPQIFATLGMVIGLYGVLYLAVAAYPEHGWLCAAVGLTGKVLGPIGLAALLISGTWPPATIVICLTNDIIWWIPFGQYLRDARPAGLSRWTLAEPGPTSGHQSRLVQSRGTLRRDLTGLRRAVHPGGRFDCGLRGVT